jgi:hypothetical protein
MKQKSRTMDTVYILIGAIFLCDPMMSVIDLLPDFIGYLLIMKGLYRMADLSGYVEDARRLCGKLVLAGLARPVSLLLIFGLVSDSERPTMTLVASFVLAVVDCLLLLPMWRKLGEGIQYLATRHGGQAAIATCRGGRSATERMVSLSCIFTVARDALATLPEFSVLAHEASGVANPDKWSMLYEYIGLLRGAACLASLVVGVVWLIALIRYARALSRDTAFWTAIGKVYTTDVLSRPDLFASRAVKRAMAMIGVAACLMIDLSFDEVCLTPDFLSAILLGVGILMLRPYLRGRATGPVLAMTSMSCLFTALSWIYETFVFPLADAGFVYKNTLLRTKWIIGCVLRLEAQISLALTLLMVTWLLCEVIRKYTGVRISGRDSADPDGYVGQLQGELRKKLWLAFGLGAGACGSSVIYLVTLPYARKTLLEIWGLVDVVVHVAFPVALFLALWQIMRQIEYKYLMS